MKRILLLVTVALMLAAAMALSGVAQAAPISDSPDAKCAKLAIKTLGSSFNPSNYTFHGGTEGDNTFTGTADPDVFCGFGGNDSIGTLEAGDIFLGGAGIDRVLGTNAGTFNGGDGEDSVYNNQGAFNGGAGDDTVGDNAGTFNGGDGIDEVVGTNAGTFNGGAGDDRVQTNSGTFNGEAGDDSVYFNFGTFNGGDGNDSVYFNYGTTDSVENGV